MTRTRPRCPVYRPDHNGECLNCDEWLDEHDAAAIAAGAALAGSGAPSPHRWLRCPVCGRRVLTRDRTTSCSGPGKRRHAPTDMVLDDPLVDP